MVILIATLSRNLRQPNVTMGNLMGVCRPESQDDSVDQCAVVETPEFQVFPKAAIDHIEQFRLS